MLCSVCKLGSNKEFPVEYTQLPSIEGEVCVYCAKDTDRRKAWQDKSGVFGKGHLLFRGEPYSWIW